MSQCSLCNGRMIKTDVGHRCMNKNCENSNLEKQHGQLCLSCNTPMDFKRNTAYGDRVYSCPACNANLTM